MDKRESYLSWGDYFMGLALLSAKRSKDPNTQVGACIVNENKKIISVGYNGMPIGCSDDAFPWSREGEDLNTKYPYVVHAELNAILNSKVDLSNCTIYVTMFPCNECTKAIIQSGIKHMLYLTNKYPDSTAVKASMKMLDSAGITYEKYIPRIDSVVLNYKNE